MARYDFSKPATKQEPCLICGKTDHCWRAYYGSKDGWLHYCAKEGQNAVFGRDGAKYLLKVTSAFPGGRSGGYFVYEAEEQQLRHREEYIAELKAKNPNYNYNNNYSGKNISSPMPPPVAIEEVIEIDKVEPLPNKRLHEVYSYLLSLLVLEDEHKKALLDEWNSGLVNPNLGEELLASWPIRSLPMNDRARKACGVQLRNPTRRKLVECLVERFGSLKGVPGFFMETVRWMQDGREMCNTHWQMAFVSGIVFPCYDSEGYIYRIRIGDEHPTLQEYARDENGQYLYYDYERRVQNKDGSWGVSIEKKHVISADYRWDFKTGEWYGEDRNTGEKHIVYSLQKNIQCFRMSPKGYPIIDGKVDGKYKNFSSYRRVEEVRDGKKIAYNGYSEGCRSGSPVSLYVKEGDNMDFLYITEGEKKGKVINAFLHCPVAVLPGVGTFSKLFEKEYGKPWSIMEYLLERGLKAVIVVYDADKATNDAVLGSEIGTIERCRSMGILTYVGEWDARYGKGADDVLIQGKTFEFYER